PILLPEILRILNPQPGHIAVDATLGYGGHARELLAAIQPGGLPIATDTDPLELPKSEARLRALGFPPDSLLVRRMNFAGLQKLLAETAPQGADLILADLGVSSMQIDNPSRGFSFKIDGPLDLRMNPQRGLSAASLLTKLSPPQLEKILTENADEPHAALIASSLFTPSSSPIPTTPQLAHRLRQILQTLPTTTEVDLSIRRVFQALRIAVNDEFSALDTFLRHLPKCLKPGGRLAILSFHSGEDRRVKHALKSSFLDGDYSAIAPDILRPTPDEQRSNPRSSSAKLRWAIRSA
ncbi:MAG: 16S rRNA (cytosine(1402)-N(4))-methyltransferase RsmH, partial [Verrucomicrobiota bacterium]